MQHTLTCGLFLSLLAGATAFAEGQPGQAGKHDTMQQTNQAAAKATQLTEGIVKKVNLMGGNITLKHGEIVNVMPAMTMTYRVKQAQQLESIRVGDKVRFAVEMQNDDYVVTHIELVK